MSAVQKHAVLSLQTKYTIMNRLERRDTVTQLGDGYGIGKSIVCAASKEAQTRNQRLH